MTDSRAWAVCPKWRRLESAHSYAQRQCHATGIPLEDVERGLTSKAQPYIYRVWADESTSAAIVEAAAGRPDGHYQRLKNLAQPDPSLVYPERFLCRLCAAGERVEQIPHDRENWCLRHPGQMVWAGPDTLPESQRVLPFERKQAQAERMFRRLVAAGRVRPQLHARVWEMVRDNARLARQGGEATAVGDRADYCAVGSRVALYPEVVAVLNVLSNPTTVERWRIHDPRSLRDEIAKALPRTDGPVDVLVERIVLWMRPLRRKLHPTRVDPLDVPLDVVDPTVVIDTTAPYPSWIQRHPRAVAEWDWSRNDPARDPWDAPGSSRTAWWVCDEGHSWQTKPLTRGLAETGCPYCAGQRVWPGHTDLGTVYPEIAAEWDRRPGTNVGGPDHIGAKSPRKVAWECHLGHHWAAPVSNRTGLGSSCPCCSGRSPIVGVNDLATLRPDLAAEWDAVRNGQQSPSSVTLGSSFRAWWNCARGHAWQTRVVHRSSGHGCPFCCGLRPIPGESDLTTLRPDLAAEWDISNELTADQVTPYSRKRVVWRCARSGHTWEATVGNRAHGRGCRQCRMSEGAVPPDTSPTDTSALVAATAAADRRSGTRC